jgi:hypothetical protein
VSLSPTSGTGDKAVTITVAANTGAARSGMVTIAGKTYSISQAATTALNDFSDLEGNWTFSYTIASTTFTSEYEIGSDGSIVDSKYSFYKPNIGNQGYTVLGGTYTYYVYGGDWSTICDDHFFFNYVPSTDSLEGIYVLTDPGGDPFDPSERPYPMTGYKSYLKSKTVGTQADALAEKQQIYDEALEYENQ